MNWNVPLVRPSACTVVVTPSPPLFVALLQGAGVPVPPPGVGDAVVEEVGVPVVEGVGVPGVVVGVGRLSSSFFCLSISERVSSTRPA